MFKTILVGFDGSARSEDALALGGLIARVCEGRLIAACVYDLPPLSGERDALTRVLRDEAQQIAAQAVRISSVAVAEAIAVEESGPARGVERAAAECGADLVVVGSSHRGALGRVTAGSVPERLLRDACCPIAIAPAGYVTGEEPRLASIGVGFDGTLEARAALDAAAAIARRSGARVRVIGVIGTRLRAYVPSALALLPHADHLRAIEARERLSVEEAAHALRDVRATAEPRPGEPVSSLKACSRELDLLVLGSHGYGALRRLWHGSVSTPLVRSAACPLLVLPRLGVMRRELEAAALPAARRPTGSPITPSGG